jgi:putative ABC transport system permease protein
MSKFYFLKLALTEFKVHKRRLILTTLAIAWGTFTILILLAFGEGLKRELVKSGKGMGENLVVVWGGQTSKPYKGLPAGRTIRFSKEDIKLIKASIPEIKSISGETNRWDVDASVGKIQRSIMVVGVDDQFGEMRNQIPQMGSRFLHPEDVDKKKRVVFMGWDVINKFFKPEDAVGKTIIIDKIPFMIIGILKEKMQSSNYNNMDQAKSYIPETTFEAMYGDRYYSNLVYSLNDIKEARIVEKKLYKVLAAKYQFDPEDEMTLGIWDVIKMHEMTEKAMLSLQIFLGIIGGLTLIISGVGLANIMYVSIKERTREIGVKLAIGAHPKQILRQIISESFFFSLIGGGIGTFFALILIQIVKNIQVSNMALAFLTHPRVSGPIAFTTISVLTLITFFAGYFPARKAAKANPIEALRYE